MTAEQIADALRELRDAAQRERLASEEAESLYAEHRRASDQFGPCPTVRP